MHTGILWFDDSDTKLSDKIRKAANYYAQKYGRRPTLALLHPSTLGEHAPEVEGVTLRPYRPVLPGHIWIGVDDTPPPDPAARG